MATHQMENVIVRDGTLVEQQLFLLDTGLMADCTFVVSDQNTEQKTFHCHKLMLSKSSEVFYAMFYGGLNEKGEIQVNDIAPNHFRKMLEFIYADAFDLEDVETALGVCYAANKYLIEMLRIKCVEYIKEHVAARNVCLALEFSRLICNHKLEDACIEFIQNNTEQVLTAESFQKINLESLLTILKLEVLNVDSELSLFSACMTWAEANKQEEQSLRDTLGPALKYIRFRTLTPEEFAVHVCPTKILSSTDECTIFCCLTIKTNYMPLGFSNETNTRVMYHTKNYECLIMLPQMSATRYRSFDTSNWFWRFKLDINVIMHGLLVCAWRHNVSAPYQEAVEVVLRQGKSVITTAKYEGELSYGSVFNVNFDKPVRINAGNYELFLVYAEQGNIYYDCVYHNMSKYRLSSDVTLHDLSGYTHVCGFKLATVK